MKKYLKSFLILCLSLLIGLSYDISHASKTGESELDVLISKEYLEKVDDISLHLWDISGADIGDKQKFAEKLEDLSEQDLAKEGYKLVAKYGKDNLLDPDSQKYDVNTVGKILKISSLEDNHTYYLTDRSDNESLKLSPSIFVYPEDTKEFYVAMKSYKNEAPSYSEKRVKLIKINQDEERLEGAKFSLYKLDKNDGKETKIADYETDKNGEIIVDNLPEGDYIFRETEAPKGYTIVQDGIDFSYDNTKLDLTVVNIPEGKENENHRLKLIKVDDDNKRLEGAKFRLYKIEDDKEIELEENKIYTTDKNGEIVVENLPKGKYNFKEVEAPEGYKIVQENLRFNYEQRDLDLRLVNKKLPQGRKEFRKTDESGDKFLEGATFKVTRLNDDGVYSIVKKEGREYLISSDEKGKFVADGLEYGTYYLFEVKAPEGYKLLSEPVEFKIEEQGGETQDIMMIKNKKDTTPPKGTTPPPTSPSNPIKIPKTGDIILPLLTLAGLFIFATGFKLTKEK